MESHPLSVEQLGEAHEPQVFVSQPVFTLLQHPTIVFFCLFVFPDYKHVLVFCVVAAFRVGLLLRVMSILFQFVVY